MRNREGDEWHYEYLVMLYGLIAPSVFQAFLDEIFRDLHGQGVVVYIDDILIYSATHAEHLSLCFPHVFVCDCFYVHSVRYG